MDPDHKLDFEFKIDPLAYVGKLEETRGGRVPIPFLCVPISSSFG